MYKKQSLERRLLYLASPHGQGIVAAPQAYFAKQSMERVRRGTAESPVYTLSAKGSQRINAPKVAYGNYSRGIMLGCIYDMKHKPPQHSTDNPSHSYLVQTKKHRLEIIDEDGKEEIRVETAEGKQIAVQDDKVMGFDVHIMVVPSGNGTTTVPLPHPFIGKLADKLSKDVKIKDKACATKDSVAKHDDSMHMQLPGTIKFQNNPKKEGKVTGGTSSKVKINGKEVAVIGSQVSTCNDVGAQNNSTVIAPGASMPMPVIINPKNTEEWKREQEEKEKKEPKFSSVKWGCSSVEEGKEVELTASVQDIEDGNMVTLQVFPEGKGPEDGVPVASFPLTVKGGSVSAKWSYRANKSEMPPENDPKFVFSAHCAWCNFEKSSNSVEVKLIRPEIKKAEWQDKDGASKSKGLVGETLKLHAETKDMEGGVTFRIYDDKGRQVFETGAEIEGDKAEAEWTYHWNGEKLEEKPKFTFEVTGQRCKRVESSEVEISGKLSVQLTDEKYKTLGDLKMTFFYNDESEDVQTDSNGLFEKEDLIPGYCHIDIETSNDYKRPQANKIENIDDFTVIDCDKTNSGFYINLNTYTSYLVKCNLNNEKWSK